MLADRMSRLDGREKFLLLLMMLVVLALLLDWLVFGPLNAKCVGLDADIARELKTLTYQRSMLQAGPLVEQRYASIGPSLGSTLPPAEAKNAMKEEIAQIATDSDVALLATKGPESRATEFYDEYTLDISDFETDEQGILRFLHTVMLGEGTYRIARLKLAPDSTGKRVKGTMRVTKVIIPAPPS
ncbi:MAG: hypothetical protein O3B24_07565 [Verrucomicrobia bacterium]|nr:hypothetical protein [Verrucomicrobiota bacterium]